MRNLPVSGPTGLEGDPMLASLNVPQFRKSAVCTGIFCQNSQSRAHIRVRGRRNGVSYCIILYFWVCHSSSTTHSEDNHHPIQVSSSSMQVGKPRNQCALPWLKAMQSHATLAIMATPCLHANSWIRKKPEAISVRDTITTRPGTSHQTRG